MYERRVYLYGFDSLHCIVDCEYIRGSSVSIWSINQIAREMMTNNVIKSVYAVDNSSRLAADYWKSVKSKDFTTHIEFEDFVKQNGIRVDAK